MRACKNAELEANVTQMAEMLKSGAWGPMSLTGPAADLHEAITRLHMDLEEVAAERDCLAKPDQI